MRRDKRRNKNKQHKCVWGCALLLPKLSLFKKNKRGDDVVGEKTKERKKKTETQDLTSREFFRDTFGSEKPNNKAKHRQNSTKKHTTNTDAQKQKFAPENFSQTATLRREER